MQILKHILNIIFPTLCKQCGGAVNSSSPTSCFCNNCWDGIRWFDAHCCPRCGIPYPFIDVTNPFAHVCGECIKNPPYFDKAISAGPYSDTLAEAIKLFKYKKKIHIGRALTEETMKLIPDEHHPLIPVPLHPQRLREREFNQSAIIASVISSRFEIPLLTDVLLRQRYTKPQVELGFRERKENVAGAFILQNKKAIKNRHIILVDDVFTTGSTVNECAKVLKNNGAGKVFVITIARMV